MGATAELRWFFERSAPPALAVWFHSAQRHGCAAGGGRTSTDAYFIEPGNPRVGTKRRGGKPGLEIKLLADVLPDGCGQAPFEGRIELWVKQHVTLLHTNGMLPVEVVKRRWLRWFDCSGGVVQELPLGADETMPGPERASVPGCQVELAELELAPGVRWMTLAFEASGPVDSLVDSLRQTAAALAERSPPGLDGPVEASYPAWLPRAVT